MNTSIFKVLAAAGTALAAIGVSTAVQAQEKYIGEIFMMGSNFCPRGSANADGQILPIAQNSALFSLFGTIYGGDGRTTFALPDLRGRSPVHVGQGPGLSNYNQGQKGGSETVTLTEMQLPSHKHKGLRKAGERAEMRLETTDSGGQPVRANTGLTGGSQPVNIRDPYTTIRYCVVLQGVYPSRN